MSLFSLFGQRIRLMNMMAVDADPATEAAYRQAIAYLYDRINYERMSGGRTAYPFRLERIAELMDRLGLQKYLYQPGQPAAVPLVHIAGTKGKGSVAAMVAAGLSRCGLRTGLYTSPHLVRLEERFCVDGQPCSADEVIELVQKLKSCVAPAPANSPAPEPSFFELTTAMALLHFETLHCDCVVLEVGLGGRLDSTNVCSPSITAITSIGLDHQHVLGDTLAQIAAEKAGIIKPGVPVVSGVTAAEPAAVIHQIAADRDAPLFQLGEDFHYHFRRNEDWGGTATVSGGDRAASPAVAIPLALEGEHQARNAAIAWQILQLLAQRGMKLQPQSLSDAFTVLQCPGRLERIDLPQRTTAILDAAHNQDSIAALCECLRARRADRPITVVFATSRDKGADKMLPQLASLAERIVLTRFHGNPRSYPTDSLAAEIPLPHRHAVTILDDPLEACRFALQQATPGGLLVVCGSFFLVGETRRWLHNAASAASLPA